MTGARIAVPLGLAVAMAIAGLTIAPRGFDAEELLLAQDDPVALADRAIARSFDATVAAREINAALAANDADLAQSFLELARDRNVPVDSALAQKVELANAGAASAARSIESFARGLVTGEPEDLAGLAGTAVGDLFVFGDIRDAVREGTRLASGQEADQLILGLAGVGLAVTAGTYASAGVGAPARVGLTVVKAARKTGRIGSNMAAWISRSLREVVDWSALQRAARGARVTEPAVAMRAAREAVKVDKAQGLVRLVSDVGRVQAAGRNAGRARRIEACRGAARHGAHCPPGGDQGRQDPRNPQARRPRRHSAHGQHVQPRDVGVLGDPDDLRFRVVAQAHDRTGHRAPLCASQAAPGARAGRARTLRARAARGGAGGRGGGADGDLFHRAALGTRERRRTQARHRACRRSSCRPIASSSSDRRGRG